MGSRLSEPKWVTMARESTTPRPMTRSGYSAPVAVTSGEGAPHIQLESGPLDDTKCAWVTQKRHTHPPPPPVQRIGRRDGSDSARWLQVCTFSSAAERISASHDTTRATQDAAAQQAVCCAAHTRSLTGVGRLVLVLDVVVGHVVSSVRVPRLLLVWIDGPQVPHVEQLRSANVHDRGVHVDGHIRFPKVHCSADLHATHSAHPRRQHNTTGGSGVHPRLRHKTHRQQQPSR